MLWVMLLSLGFGGCGIREETLIISPGEEFSGKEMLSETGTSSGDGDVFGQDNTFAGQPPQESENADIQPEKLLYVHVCGCVREPGVAALPEGSRAGDALAAAGGFSEDADRDYVNLAAKVADGEKLYFPSAAEAESLQEEAQEADSHLVDINSAEEALLCTLPGIGASRAEAIIAYREEHGPFETGEDIMKVPGIKEGAYEKLKDRITVK